MQNQAVFQNANPSKRLMRLNNRYEERLRKDPIADHGMQVTFI